MSQLLHTMTLLDFDSLSAIDRTAILIEMQRWLVKEKLGQYPETRGLRFRFRPTQTSWHNMANLLAAARAAGKEGPVAQYLVGAKLAMRFPQVDIRNDSYSTSDVQSGLPGDFLVGGTAFHVTVAPMPQLYEKASGNIDVGYRVYILVPEGSAAGARQICEAVLPGRISVQSIESFVSQNLDEMEAFAASATITGFRRLLDIYNARVDAIEADKSLLIEIPHNL